MTEELSYLERLKLQPPEVVEQFLQSLTVDEALDLLHSIETIGRPKQQLPEGDWTTWLILAGRGFGKTFVGAHTVNNWARQHPGCRIALVGETVADVRDVMINGDSGILKQADPRFQPIYEPSKRLITYPNGSLAQTFSGEEPDQLRGPQFHFAWVDELAKLKYQNEVWDMLQFCMRLGDIPKVLVTTTPRPTTLIKTLASDPHTHVTRGSTFENKNLPTVFLDALQKKYEGTRLGQQELYAAILDDNPGALFKQLNIDSARVKRVNEDGVPLIETMDRIVVAIDPAVTANERSDETGLIVAGRKGDDGYIFADESLIAKPSEWARKAITAYNTYQADSIVAEVNQGGDMVESTVRNIDKMVRFRQVRATRGKAIRAEPIASLYEQNRIHHVGYFEKLEEQMCSYDPTLGQHQKSPDRMDAMVWALTELFGANFREPQIF